MKCCGETLFVGQSFERQVIEDRYEQVHRGGAGPAHVTRERLMSKVRLSCQGCVEMNVCRAIFYSHVAPERHDEGG